MKACSPIECVHNFVRRLFGSNINLLQYVQNLEQNLFIKLPYVFQKSKFEQSNGLCGCVCTCLIVRLNQVIRVSSIKMIVIE